MASDIVKLANISKYWKMLVLNLSPSFFMTKIDMIENENKGDCFMQTVAALKMWNNAFDGEAAKEAMISAMCTIGFRLQATNVFGSNLVEYVCPIN